MKIWLMKRVAVLVAVVMMAMSCAALAEAVVDTQKLDTYYSLAINYINREDFDKAMQYLDACFEYCDEATNPDLSADLHLKKGCVYTMTGDDENALKELDESIRIKESLSEAWLVKTQVYSDSGRYGEAIECLEKYIEMSGNKEMYETLAQLYQQNGEAEKALESYNNFADSSAEDGIEASYRKGVYKMGVGLYADAIEDFERCRKDETYGVSAAYNVGVCHMNAGSYEEALEALSECIEAGGEIDGVRYNRGVCHMSLGNFAEAVEDFTASIDGESFKLDATYNRAVCRMSGGEYAGAVEDFTTYIDERIAAVEAEAEAAEEDDETEPQTATDVATYYRAVCYLSMGEYESAVKDFTTCVDDGVAAEDSLFNRGLSYLQGGDYEAAKADFTTCIENETNDDAATFYRAYAHRYLGDNEAALEDLTACIKSEYNLGQSYYQRAQVYSDMNDEEHYVEDLEASLKY